MMRALQIRGQGDFELDNFPIPTPEPGEVLVRTSWASICGSDLHNAFHRGRTEPAAPGGSGHETVGQIVESRSPWFRPGDTVLAVPDVTCMRGFADYQAVPDRFLLRIPDEDLPLVVMSQQLGTVRFALARFLSRSPQRREAALVIGAGSAGLHFVALLRRMGFETIVCSDVDDARLKAAAAMGADYVVNTAERPASSMVLDLTHGVGAPLVVEAAGMDSTRADAVLALADDGDLGCFGLPERSGAAGFPFEEFFRKRGTLHVSSLAQREPQLASFAEAVRLIRDGEIDVRPMLGTPFMAEDMVEAMVAANNHTADSTKVVVDFR